MKSSPRQGFWTLAAWLALAAALVFLVCQLGQPLHGAHVFRQAQVAANIERMLADGLLAPHMTYNLDMPGRVYDLPVYQALCVGLARLSGLTPVLAARLLSGATFVVGFFVVRKLLATSASRDLTLVFYCLAPIQLFYASVPLPDNLACLAALVAALAFQRWDSVDGVGSAGWWALAWILAACLATAIKPPVFLPLALAMALLLLQRSGPRVLKDRVPLLAGAAVIASLAGHVLVAKGLNLPWREQHFAPTVDSTSAWYFSDLADRGDPALWGRILRDAFKYLLSPVSTVLFAWGIVVALRSRAERRDLLPWWMVGALANTLVFFNLHWRHSYYLLPYVVPMCYFAARGCQDLEARIPMRPIRTVVRAALLAATALFAAKYVGRLEEAGEPQTSRVRLAGVFLRHSTDPEDFIVYPVRVLDHQPQHLFFAGREGYMVAAAEMTPTLVDRLFSHYAPAGRHLVFVPSWLARELPGWSESAPPGFHRVTSGREGVLLERVR